MVKLFSGVWQVCGRGFGAVLMVLALSSVAMAGDHLSSSSGCVDCHGDNVRMVHDYDYTIEADCDICHAAGGPAWPLNDKVYAMFSAYYTEEFNPLEPYKTGYVLPDGFDFDFACKACHVGQNPGHQN